MNLIEEMLCVIVLAFGCVVGGYAYGHHEGTLQGTVQVATLKASIAQAEASAVQVAQVAQATAAAAQVAAPPSLEETGVRTISI